MSNILMTCGKILIGDLMKNEVLNLMIDGFSLRDIAFKTSLSLDEVYDLACKYNFKRTVLDSGDLVFEKHDFKTNTVNLKLSSNNFKAMLISDLHFGNFLQNLDYLYLVYDFCIDNDIHVIINGGDLIDGIFTKGRQAIMDPFEQVSFALENYPYDERIINLICLGNHDYDVFDLTGLDVQGEINKRFDLISFGYGFGIINIQNDQIIVKHPISINDFIKPLNKLILEGHRHKMCFGVRKDDFTVSLPTLSDLCFKGHVPGAVLMSLDFDKGFITNGLFKHFMVTNKLSLVSEARFDFFFSRSFINEDIVRRKIKKIPS